MTSQETKSGDRKPPSLDISEIGSDFELAESKYLTPGESPRMPWEDSLKTIYVESGRQALGLVEAELRTQGHTHLHVPSYLCDTMIEPFQRNRWTFTTLSVDRNLVVSPEEILDRVTDGVLLHTPYFGRQDSPAMLEALDAIRKKGVIVVVDETHRVFSGPSPVADIRVASLRKLFPLYDGGYVAGLSRGCQPDRRTSPPHVAALRHAAMVAKSHALASGDGGKGHIELFATAERATDTRTDPARMSTESLSLLRHLDMELIQATRLVNSVSLTMALVQSDQFRVINPPADDLLPSHLVLETDAALELRQFLIERRVYCPIHWPPSELLERSQEWPSCYISLPIDQRYAQPDMLRIASCIREFFSRKYPKP